MLWNIASTYSAILIPSGQAAVLGFTMPLWSALIALTINNGAYVAEILRAADDTGMLVSFSQPHFSHYDWQAPDS